MTTFLQNNNGIKSHHHLESLLFEKEYFPPDYGSKLISRLYLDGSLYYLSQVEKSHGNDIVEKWNFISTVSEKGLKQILANIKKCCKVKNEVKVSGNSVGTAIWRLQCTKKVKEIIVLGIPDNKLKYLIEIDNLVSANMQTISAG